MNYAKISCIGYTYPTAGRNSSFEEVIRIVTEGLTREVDRVLPDSPDLILFPENCDICTDYKTAEFHEYKGSRIRDVLAGICADNNCMIAFPHVRPVGGGRYFNSIEFLGRDGSTIGIYDKNYVTIGEYQKNILFSKRNDLIDLGFTRAAGAVCFDLNFDGILNVYKARKPGLIVFCSSYHGGQRQKEWAYGCRSYFAGAIANRQENRILNPLGETVAASTNYYNFVTADVNFDYFITGLGLNRSKLDAAKRKYGAGIRIFDPGYLSCVLVTSEIDGLSAAEIAAEFELWDWSDYLAHIHQLREDHAEE